MFNTPLNEAHLYNAGFARVYCRYYSSFARDVAFDALHWAEAYRPDRPLRVLDLCCGVGDLALTFAEAGHQVIGLDISPAMVSVAKETAGAAKLEVDFVVDDARTFNLREEVDFIFCLNGSLSSLGDVQSLRACISRMSMVLASGGIFLGDLFTADALAHWNHVMVADEEDRLQLIRGMFDVGGRFGSVQISGCLRDTEGSWSRFRQILMAWLIEEDDMIQAFKEHGFVAVEGDHRQALTSIESFMRRHDRMLCAFERA
jgi:SAM-dependent methyltransferase